MTESSDSAEPGATLPAGLAETLAHAPAPSEVDPDLPARIGPYSIIDRLGQGGMGSVYLAQQHEPVERRVALKVITLGKDTREVVARFEAERQTLALMNHPYIAKVFDAGATAEGRPYFAMEYTAGDPITVFCDRHRLGIRARLQLFVDVCHAVQHAHQKGVIHRDLKPSNILVGQDNGTPAPKVIDFGIAKAMGESSADVTALTRANEAIGTPLYMSPEQAGLAERDIDTRSDVYALGVILYELLSGTLPYFDGGLGTSTWEEVRRAIRDDDPLTPSSRLSRLNAERGAAVARARQIERTALRKQLRGDLDWIVLKALAKDRTRRYGSTSELADDIGRHLEHQPVVAGPPGAAYRVRKFVRRHAWGVAAALAFGLLLVGFPATTAVQAARVARERDRLAIRGVQAARVARERDGTHQQQQAACRPHASRVSATARTSRPPRRGPLTSSCSRRCFPSTLSTAWGAMSASSRRSNRRCRRSRYRSPTSPTSRAP